MQIIVSKGFFQKSCFHFMNFHEKKVKEEDKKKKYTDTHI